MCFIVIATLLHQPAFEICKLLHLSYGYVVSKVTYFHIGKFKGFIVFVQWKVMLEKKIYSVIISKNEVKCH